MNNSEAEQSRYKVRGLLFGAVYGWFTETYDKERLDVFTSDLPPGLKRQVKSLEEGKYSPADMKEWYPCEEVYPLYEHLVDYLSNEMNEKQVVDAVVGFMFRQSVTGFMKGLMSFLTPAALIRRSSTFWRRVHSSGEVTIRERDKTSLEITLSDWKAHRISCEIFESWTRRLLTLIGRTVTGMTKTRCVLQGDDACSWEVTFS
jgi:hypothetical protein